MEEGSNGVHITLREIYDKLDGVATDVRTLQSSMEIVEEQGKEIKEVRTIAEEASATADKALTMVTKHDNNISWLWRTVIGVLLTSLLGGILTLFFILLQNAVTPPAHSPAPEEKIAPEEAAIEYIIQGGEVIEYQLESAV